MSYTSCLMQLKTQTKAAFYALEAVITELEATRDRLLSGLVDRVVDQAAALAVCSRDWQCLGLSRKRRQQDRSLYGCEDTERT
jgi:hypothetical protein